VENQEQETMLKVFEELSICLIDDSRSFCAGVKNLLVGLNCKFTSYTDPELALRQLKEFPVDIVVTDYDLGTMTGLDVIRRLRADPKFKTVPILVLTSNTDPRVLVSTILAGADAFVKKEDVHQVLVAQLTSLARVHKLYGEVIRLKQFSAIKSLIGTYKHEFGNTLAILDGKVNRFERMHPELGSDESLVSIKKNLERMENTLQKLAQLQNYQEQVYSETDTILKIA
jgi:two-component system chemotaxis response regulator CheY